MTGFQLEVLSCIVDRYDAGNGPVTAASVASDVDCDVRTIQSCLRDLEAYDLIARVEAGGYRPTITGREMLELDLREDSILILDIEPDE